MDLGEFRKRCLDKKGAVESFPFDENTLVFKVMGKIFALVALEGFPIKANLKCHPESAIELREQWDGTILPGYHMNKKHWNSVILSENLPASLIKKLIDDSYELVVGKLTKKERALLERP